MPGEQGGGAGEGRQIPGRAGQPERRGKTALPDGPAIKSRNTPARLPPRFPTPGKCTSHLGFGLGSVDAASVVREDGLQGVGHALVGGQQSGGRGTICGSTVVVMGGSPAAGLLSDLSR